MIRPTLKAVLLFALSIPFALVVLAGFQDVWYISIYPPAIVLALAAADFAMILPNRKLYHELEGPAQLYVGQIGEVFLRLAAEDHSAPVPIEALLEQTGEADEAVPASGILRDGTLSLCLGIAPRRRGKIVIEALWLRWRGPFGLVELSRRAPVGEAIETVPDIRNIHQEALKFFARDASFGQKAQNMRGEGVEFEALREYAQGMDNRFIDWKRSAHHRKLLCKEFRQERNHQIILGFDTGRLMTELIDGAPKLDHAIKAGLLLGWASLHGGDLIGGCGFDAGMRSFLKPGRGMPYFTRFQSFAANLSYEMEETNFTLGLAELNGRLGRRALIVLFSEFVDQISAELLIESLQLLTRRHLVIFVTLRDPLINALQDGAPDGFADIARAVIADDFRKERAVVLERVARLGVHCIDAPSSGVSSALLNRYLTIKQRGLL